MPPTYPDATATRLADLCGTYLRRPTGYATDDTTGSPILTFDPDLTAEEQTTYERLFRIANARVTGITPTEFQSLEAGVSRLRAYRTTASPTNASTVQAVKDVIDVLRAILRD